MCVTAAAAAAAGAAVEGEVVAEGADEMTAEGREEPTFYNSGPNYVSFSYIFDLCKGIYNMFPKFALVL